MIRQMICTSLTILIFSSELRSVLLFCCCEHSPCLSCVLNALFEHLKAECAVRLAGSNHSPACVSHSTSMANCRALFVRLVTLLSILHETIRRRFGEQPDQRRVHERQDVGSRAAHDAGRHFNVRCSPALSSNFPRVASENARLYSHLAQYSRTLEEKVSRRTADLAKATEDAQTVCRLTCVSRSTWL